MFIISVFSIASNYSQDLVITKGLILLPKCDILCLLNASLLRNALGQFSILQWNGFSPKCIFIWVFKLPTNKKYQNLHLAQTMIPVYLLNYFKEENKQLSNECYISIPVQVITVLHRTHL